MSSLWTDYVTGALRDRRTGGGVLGCAERRTVRMTRRKKMARVAIPPLAAPYGVHNEARAATDRAALAVAGGGLACHDSQPYGPTVGAIRHTRADVRRRATCGVWWTAWRRGSAVEQTPPCPVIGNITAGCRPHGGPVLGFCVIVLVYREGPAVALSSQWRGVRGGRASPSGGASPRWHCSSFVADKGCVSASRW